MKYKLLTAREPEDLEAMVSVEMSQGWEPIGGIACTEFERNYPDSGETVSRFVQAMILRGD